MGESSQTTETTREPWGPAAGPIQNTLIPLVEGALGRPLNFNQQFVGRTPGQQAGLDQQMDYATGGMGQLTGEAQQAWRNNLDPMHYIGSDSPIWGGLQGVFGDLNRQLSETVLPGLTSGAIGSGAVGGSREALAKGLAGGRAMETGQEAISGLMGNVFSQALGAQQNALNMSPMMANLGLLPGQTQYNLGGINRAEEQALADFVSAEKDFAQMEPWQRIGLGAGTLAPLAGLGGTDISTTTKQSSPFDLLLSGGMMGLGMMGGGSPFNPFMMGGGGGFGPAMNPGLATGLNPMGYYVPPNLMAGPFPGSYGR